MPSVQHVVMPISNPGPRSMIQSAEYHSYGSSGVSCCGHVWRALKEKRLK